MKLRILQIEQGREAKEGDLYFRQLLPGRDICLRTFNPIKKIVYEFARGMQNVVYVVGDLRSKQCVIVDPCWDADGIVGEVERDQMTPVALIVTHNHFDHVGGKPPPPFRSYGITVQGVKTILGKYKDIRVYINQEDADAFQVETGIDPERIKATADGEEFSLGEGGRIGLRFIHTPGHTPGAQCVQVGDGRLLTGDTLFANSCGRMDLPGGCPTTMYHTLQGKLRNFRDGTVVYPGHSYGNVFLTTIEREKRLGVLQEVTLKEWLQKLGGTPSNGSSGEGECCSHRTE